MRLVALFQKIVDRIRLSFPLTTIPTTANSALVWRTVVCPAIVLDFRSWSPLHFALLDLHLAALLVQLQLAALDLEHLGDGFLHFRRLQDEEGLQLRVVVEPSPSS